MTHNMSKKISTTKTDFKIIYSRQVSLDSYENGQAEYKYKCFSCMSLLALWIFRK